VQEEVEDVEVQIDGSQDVLLRGELVHHHVGVEHDEQREHDRTRHRDGLLHQLRGKDDLKVSRNVLMFYNADKLCCYYFSKIHELQS